MVRMKMTSPSVSLSYSAVAYALRYRAPFSSPPPSAFTPHLHLHRHHKLRPPSVLSASFVLVSSFFRLPSPNLFTGNSLFSAMEQFWSGSTLNGNKGMTDQLTRYGVIKSEKVAEVMLNIDRALFVPEGTPPYIDSPMSIGYNATISAPHMHAMCLELLEDRLQPGMHALDVGSGTGYLTACFALMVGPQGRAVGVEHIPELAAWSIKNVEKSAAAPLLKEGSLSLHVGDGRKGWPEHAPYDAIHVGAAAGDIPQALIDQLKPGGRMVIPVGTFFQDLKVVDKNLDGSVSVRSETSVRYVPLTSREAQLSGS
ncbi:PREDICTED: protein-L-isoaspartate O-methyltransferase 1-like isoform X2 [Ipomoea nil]|uniref:protein-L-isoaspartate O-methyltransferase 1-like isoform X2 n=1 Tax=Ipomoea nil TaxID=35883 RepID=UPI000901CC7E|nr:PREDICTED: protein-L-isoaspartate O-methyltransferase 1-like isoform X2 [Ipomoea nil]